MDTATPPRYRKHEVPKDYLGKWQQTIDVLASVFEVPAGLIMRVLPDEIEVLISSQSDNNPYEPGEKANLNTGLYCETVMSTRAPLHVPNALQNPDWQDNPDVALNMISYLGMPLIWPDGSVFGTVCVLDKKELKNKASYLQLVQQFKEIIERDFQMLVSNADLQDTSRQLEDARKAAESANLAKSAFLANMSHELRTPMNAILGYSEMLMEEASDTGHEDFIPDLKKINHAGTHLLALINDVLDLSKIESGHMDTYAEDIDVGSLIDQVQSTSQPLMGKNRNQFVVSRGEGLGHAFQDLTKLRQSLLNLLSNATKFTKEGEITLSARREALADGDWLEFSVSDTGIGVPADKLDKIFDEFSQADSSITRDYGGTGLGLSISRRFCRMLGGDLSVISSAGEGSTFSIRIPAKLPGSEPDASG
ncbi:MAG: sensor histidine kinase [Gammaproteobacteria bacterium]